MRQAEKMIRISDQYQAMVREINEKLLHLSTHDALTTLPNRRFAQETLDKHLDSACSTGFPLCIALLDVDHFKDINDRYGHESGDESLIAIAEGIRSSLREADFCGRWGGEEFLVTLPHTDIQVAGHVVERVRQAVAKLPAFVLDNGITIKVTISIGLTELRPGDTAKTLLSRATRRYIRPRTKGGTAPSPCKSAGRKAQRRSRRRVAPLSFLWGRDCRKRQAKRSSSRAPSLRCSVKPQASIRQFPFSTASQFRPALGM